MTQTVVITGASAGVGRAVARHYAARGARLALIARGAAGLAAAARDCRERGAAEVSTHQLDVADAGAVHRAADEVAHRWGALDVWINNAMVSVLAPAWEIPADEYRRVTEVNYLGTVYGTLAALRHMRAHARGAIVQVGSALAYRGIPLQSAYCASKHAIQGFNDSLRAELLHDCPGVTLSMVQLPAVNTPQFSWMRTRLPRHPQPVPPIFAPEVAARAIVWAADRGPRELNVGGPTWKARLGDTFFPGLLDRKLARDGYDSQQTETPIDRAAWRDNLDQPGDADRDRGAEGVFTDRARGSSAALWVGTHKPAVTAAGLGVLALALGGLARRRR
ncbi:SDR family oxidoreductase [Micromonospora inyonensis]|uniref:Short-chain dehydrogenase n=1 Tax=Micromonospora inyonensis TaxID=47866 RepID=A0A1C6SKW2_9ACTN|nr:SDR family oxidoreductase [Micromonospora inyonensis]SCL30067.1 Short-chain dehydrogenase [Micromonospora inyonensis]